jgi:hypothetical protein
MLHYYYIYLRPYAAFILSLELTEDAVSLSFFVACTATQCNLLIMDRTL